MRWSLMTRAQRQYLTLRAQTCNHVTENGKVSRLVPIGQKLDRFAEAKQGNVYAAAILAAKQEDRDYFAAQDKLAREENARLVAEYTGKITYVRPGCARGHGELQRKAARALPMTYLVATASR